MRIGILTLPLHTNYGGNLQAFALMTVLKRMGHEPYLLDRRRSRIPLLKYPFVLLKRFVVYYILGRKEISVFYEKKFDEELLIVSRYTQPFIDRFIVPKTEVLRSSKELAGAVLKYNLEAIIVGSDQVWRPKYSPAINNYFLDFINENSKIERIAYAASFGTADWEFSERQTRDFSKLLVRFNSVSVREDSGHKLCREKFGVDAVHVLDPTMLLDREDYLGLVAPSGRFEGEKKALLVYILDETEETSQLVNRITGELGGSSFRVNSKTEEKEAPVEERIAPPTEEWILGFERAEYVITDSFHACVFSILFRKPFWVYVNKNRGAARFESLLKVFGLEDRILSDWESLELDSINKTIDWDTVCEILRERKEHSFKFLEDGLRL